MVLEKADPELAADLVDRGIMLTGGGALLKGLDHFIAEDTQLAVNVVPDPLDCVVRGCGTMLEQMELLQAVSKAV